MKKHSLTRQITSIVSLLVAGAILLCWVLNTTLLPRYGTDPAAGRKGTAFFRE